MYFSTYFTVFSLYYRGNIYGEWPYQTDTHPECPPGSKLNKDRLCSKGNELVPPEPNMTTSVPEINPSAPPEAP